MSEEMSQEMSVDMPETEEAVQAEAPKAEPKAEWYVVHTYSGYENKVKSNIEKTIVNRHLEDQILEVRVLVEEVVEVKPSDGKTKRKTSTRKSADVEEQIKTENGIETKTSKRKVFPSYVLLHMVMNDDTWYVVRNTRGVTGFVGPESKPVALTEDEVRTFIDQMKPAEMKIDFAVGDRVIVTNDTWRDCEGTVTAINMQEKTVTVLAPFMGSDTSLTVSFAEVKKM